MTPLHSAAKTNHIVAAKLLIKKGAKVYDKDDNDKMPIDYAQSSQMIDLLRQDKEDNLYITISDGRIACNYCLINKKEKIIPLTYS